MRESVLIVDDDAAILKVLVLGLSSLGFEVETATGGEEGIRKLDLRQFDCLLVDLGMPNVDGFAVMKHGLTHGRCRAVVVVTGQGTIPVAVEAMRLGATDFLTKPVDPKGIEQAMRRALGRVSDEHQYGNECRQWRDRYCPGFIGDDQKIQMLQDMGCVCIFNQAGSKI